MVASVWQLLFVLLIYIFFFTSSSAYLSFYISVTEGGEVKTRSVNEVRTLESIEWKAFLVD